jgi:HK97 gp10 family phage protein
MSVTVEVKSNRDKCEKLIQADLRKSFEKIGKLVKKQATDTLKANSTYNSYEDHTAHPNDPHPQWQKGKLAANIGYVVLEENKELYAIIGLSEQIPGCSPLAYGKYLELGTYKMPAYPWLYPAMETNRQNMIDILGHKAGFGLITK